MWFFAPPKWYEVPVWLWRVWTARAPAVRPGDARPGEGPSRPATAQPWGTAPVARSAVPCCPGYGVMGHCCLERRRPVAESIGHVRRQVERMRPENCCVKQPMVAGGKRTMVCAEGCPWQELDLLVANASVDAEV